MKLRQKLIATILTVMMLTGYVTTLTNAVMAAGTELSKQNGKTNHANVEFNSYFADGNYSKTFEIGKEAKLYLKVKVSNNGYLKNGVVNFANTNFEIDTDKLKNEKIQASNKNQIKLSQINNSSKETVIEVPITASISEEVPASFFNQTAKVAFTGTYVDENGKEKEIKKELENQVNWKGTAEIELAGEVSKYVPYQIGEEKGVLVQAKIRSGLKENSLPIASTKIAVSVPEIEVPQTENSDQKTNIKPERITIVANTTKATNGKGSNEFTTTNYHYNETTGKIEIEVNNKEEKISWKKNAVDEYLVNYIYTGEEVYNYIQAQIGKTPITGQIEVTANIEAYNSEQTNLEKTGKINYTIEKEIGDIIDTSITSAEKLSKGYIYANYDKDAKTENVEAKKETEYTVNYTAQIYDSTLIDNVEFITIPENYVDHNQKEHEEKGTIYSKAVNISEAVFHKMLGENGKVEISNKDGKKIAQITKDTGKDQEGNYTVDITSEKVNEIMITTTKPVTEGNIEISVEKAITANQTYQKSEMEEFEKITLGVITKSYVNAEKTEKEETKTQETTNAQENKTQKTTIQENTKQEATMKETTTTTKAVEVAQSTKQTAIALTEPVSKAEISVGTQNLSTIVENKDVELRAVLDTSSNNNALYKNPELQIVLPENIEKIKINSVKLLLEDELKIKETKVVEENGRKIIKVTLVGTQTKYMDNGTTKTEQENVIAKGANIVIKADIAFKKLTPSASTNIYLYYTNENTNLFENTPNEARTYSARSAQTMGMAKTGIEIVSPNGVVAENHLSGYQEGESISNSTSEKQEKIMKSNTTTKEVTIGGTIINNYSNSIENVFVLGRTPFSGNKAVEETEELGSNFTMAMKEKLTISGIDSSKVKIYYSTNGEASKDLIDTNNGWTETPNNLAEVKSYLIVISGEIAKGTQLNFDYKAELPANLTYNNSTYTNYKVYYDNKMEDATLGESKVAGIIGLTTGQGPAIELSLKSYTNTVREGQIVRMTATIKNTGDLKVENAKLHITAPEGTVHTEVPEGYKDYNDSTDAEKTISIGNIASGETITRDYELRIEKGVVSEKVTDTETGEESVEEKKQYPGDKELQNTIRLSADNLTSEIKSESYTIKVLEGDLSISTISNNKDTTIHSNGDTIKYITKVTNISNDKDLNNVTLNITLPNGVKVNNVYYADTSSFSEKKTENIKTNGNNISINLGTLQSSTLYAKNLIEGRNNQEITQPQIVTLRETAYVCMELELTDFAGEYNLIMTATADGIETQYSNVRKLLAKSAKLSIEQEQLDNQYVKEGSQYTYHFVIKNTGDNSSYSNEIRMKIPEGVSLVKAEYTHQGKTITENTVRDGELIANIYSIEAGESIDLFITVKADLLPDQNDKEVTTLATLKAKGFETMESNKIKAIIEYDENSHKQEEEEQGNNNNNSNNNTNHENNNNENTYKITGTAWLDNNKDGKRDDTEELLSGIQVLLINKSNSQLVKDSTTGEEKIVTTNSNGKYEFTNIAKGEYLVVFLYDAGKYSVTDYQKDGVSKNYNSDATNMKIVLDGEQKHAGVTDTIKVTNNNVRDIDIGLFVSEKFDLRLDKYISKLTVTTNGKTKTYNYNNSKITKREFAAKDVNNSSIVIEYKIVVTNEGQIDGYAKKIIDYLPEGVKFSTELNKDWYISESNGAVYNTALANQKIAPGQSKEITLVLSLAVTDKTVGTIVNNNAEIYESYNELGLDDIDSITANRLESEDDMSNADLMLSVSTGKVVIYTTLVLEIIVLLGFGIYEIKKRVLVKKNN